MSTILMTEALPILCAEREREWHGERRFQHVLLRPPPKLNTSIRATADAEPRRFMAQTPRCPPVQCDDGVSLGAVARPLGVLDRGSKDLVGRVGVCRAR